MLATQEQLSADLQGCRKCWPVNGPYDTGIPDVRVGQQRRSSCQYAVERALILATCASYRNPIAQHPTQEHRSVHALEKALCILGPFQAFER